MVTQIDFVNKIANMDANEDNDQLVKKNTLLEDDMYKE